MNFVSHFYLDRQRSADSRFFLGVITPDLVGIFDRRIKLKPHTMPEILPEHLSLPQLAFYTGVQRHFEADAVFHTCDFFLEETRELVSRLRVHFEEDQLPRSYFLAHILVELILDKVLMKAHPEILPEFYGHLGSIPYQEQLLLTEWVCGTPMHRYQAYMMRFLEKQYLYDYAEWRHILFVMRRILDKVNISTGDTLHHPNMLRVLREYESKLMDTWPSLFQEMNQKMQKLP